MTDLALALRLLERRSTPVLSSVRIGTCDLGYALGHAHLDRETNSGVICITDTPPSNVTTDKMDGTLVHELDHIAAMERGAKWWSGEWAAKWLYPNYNSGTPDAYRLGIRRYFRRFHYERRALLVEAKLTALPETIEMYDDTLYGPTLPPSSIMALHGN